MCAASGGIEAGYGVHRATGSDGHLWEDWINCSRCVLKKR